MTTPSSPSTSSATIGRTIIVKGDLSGDEDLVIEGRVEGEISLHGHDLTVGPSGKVKADIHGQRIRIDGTVKGNLFGSEEVLIRESGQVQGNITAPRVSLENGSKFKGSIDMEPNRGGGPRDTSGKKDHAKEASGKGGANGAQGTGMPPPKAKPGSGAPAGSRP